MGCAKALAQTMPLIRTRQMLTAEEQYASSVQMTKNAFTILIVQEIIAKGQSQHQEFTESAKPCALQILAARSGATA